MSSASSSSSASGNEARATQTHDHLRVLPASANWYCSKVCDWGYSSALGLLIAFGAKDSVFVYQVPLADSSDSGAHGIKQQHQASARTPATSDSSALRFVAHLTRGRKDQRVTALQFLQSSSGALELVIGGEEGSVQVWDVATHTLVEQQRSHTGVEVMAVTAIDSTLLVAGDRQGRISVWQRNEESVALVTPVTSDGVFAMAIAPHDRALVAVGYRSGVLCIVDVLQGAVRHRLEGHDQEVQCVVWRAPAAAEANLDERDASALLASSSRDRTIKVWRVSASDADAPQLEQQLTLPKPKQGSSYSQSKRLWLPIAWSDAANSSSAPSKAKQQTLRLWSGSFDGNLFAWEWSAPPLGAVASSSGAKMPPCKPIVIKNGHSRLLFNIVSLGSAAMRAPVGAHPQLLTMSLDRDVRIWRESAQASALVCRDTLSGLGGYVYSVAYNAETDVVAAGVGDQTIRLWRLGSAASRRSRAYDVELLWKGLQSKVTCVAWSPFERTVLAFGTDDGHVGVVDVASKKTVRLKARHSSAVQTLQWRITSTTGATAVAAEAIEGGSSSSSSASAFVEAMQALESAQASGQRLEDALEAQVSSPSPPSLELRLWSQDAKATQVLESDPAKPDAPSRVLPQRACSAFVWTVRGDRVALGRDSGAVEVFASGAADLTPLHLCHEHEQRIVCLAWSADGSALASASQDGKIAVVHLGDDPASALRSSVLAGHSSAVTGLQWRDTMLASSSIDGTVQVWDTTTDTRVSRFQHHAGRALAVAWIDAFTLVSGGDDQTIRVWDYRAQTTVSRSLKASAPAANHQRGTTASGTAGDSAVPRDHRPETPANSVADSVSAAKKPTGSSSGSKAKRKVKTRVFHTDAPVAVDEALTAEAHAYAQEQDWEHAAQVHLLQGNVADALRVVAKEGALTASWLALAPMAGTDVWRELTNVFAQQLEARGDKRSAALHYLSIGKTRAAVKAFASGHAYAEALALVQTRLGLDDPLLSTTLLAYAAYLETHARYGEAAQMLLRVGTASASARAVGALVKAGTGDALAAALDVLDALARSSGAADTGSSAADTDDDDAWSIPSSVALNIVRLSVQTSDFALAARASAFIGTVVCSSSSSSKSVPTTATRLTQCFLHIAHALARHGVGAPLLQIETDDDGRASDALELPADVPDDARAFVTYLITHCKRGYDDALGPATAARDRQAQSQRLWTALLTHCRAHGFWFGDALEDDVLAAQELLMDKRFFAHVVGAASASTRARDACAMPTLLRVSHVVLQLLLDLVCGYLLSALERARDALETASQGAAEPCSQALVRLVTLVFPSGFIDADAPPQIGELAVEVEDARAFWRACLALQCSAAVAVAETRGGDGGATSSGRTVLERLLQDELADARVRDGVESTDATPEDAATQARAMWMRADLRARVQELLSASGAATESSDDK